MANLQIFVQGEGKRDIRVVELPAQATVRELVEAAQAQGVTPQKSAHTHDVVVFVENGHKPLALDATLESLGIGNHGSVHLSRCAHVTVTVHYNGKETTDTFGPGVPMHRIKEWAVGKKGFGLDPVDAGEHVLQLTGTSDRPDEDVHIGSLVGASGCEVQFDLVAKVRVEG